LTEEEKKIHDNAKRRGDLLNIDFDKKVEKKKWETFLVDDKVFTQHYAFRLLMLGDDKLDEKIARQLDRDYKVLNARSLLTKVKLIGLLEKALGVITLDIDTKREIGRFKEVIEISGDLKQLIDKVFRVSKKKCSMTFEYWYYQLIQMYKNVLGCDMFKYKLIKVNGSQHQRYVINCNIFNKNKDPLNL
jgi:hypothetical protein